jgi:hydrogenase/urease accessory protein HupE
MKIKNAIKNIASLSLLASSSSIFAHEGHGMQGTHWHSTDVWGFVAVGGMIALGIWLSRGDK